MIKHILIAFNLLTGEYEQVGTFHNSPQACVTAQVETGRLDGSVRCVAGELDADGSFTIAAEDWWGADVEVIRPDPLGSGWRKDRERRWHGRQHGRRHRR